MLDRAIPVLGWSWCAVLAAAQPAAEVRFTGEATLGQPFERQLAPDLYFRLHPTETGWHIRVGSTAKAPNDFTLVTLPLRWYRPVYVEPGYSLAPREIVERPHAFLFVLNERDYARARALNERLLWPGNAPKGAAERAGKELQSLRLGWGELQVKRSRLGPDRIEWIAFQVRIVLDPPARWEEQR
jgi:hypothetical protein